MQFLVNMFNHNDLGQRSLEDVVGIFGNQLRALGHEAIWRTANDQFIRRDSGINIVVEGFTPSSIQVIANAHAQGCRFLCIATEEPTSRGFNHGRDIEMAWRQKYFADAAQFFDGVFHLVPGEHITRWYGQWAPAAYIELGFATSLVRRTFVEPKFEFGFYGSISRRRLKILRRLAAFCQKPNAIRVCGDFPSQDKRDSIMREAKVIIQIRKYDEMGLVSSSRCNTALMVGRPVVAESHDLSEPWDRIVKFSDNLEDFYKQACWATVFWKDLHRKQMEAFQNLLSPEVCVGIPLKKIKLDLTPPKFPFNVAPTSTFPRSFAGTTAPAQSSFPMSVIKTPPLAMRDLASPDKSVKPVKDSELAA